MGDIVVKDNVRYRGKDADRVDVVVAGQAVRTKVPAAEPEPEVDESASTDEAATKVVDPEVTKVREPAKTKRRGGRSAAEK